MGWLWALVGPYRALLRRPGTRSLVVASIVARLPVGMYQVAVLLFVRDSTGSFAHAGAVSAAFTIATSVVAPMAGRMADRFGHRRVLAPMALLHALALIATVEAGLRDAPLSVIMAFALVSGALVPPVSASMRALWSRWLADDLEARTAAMSLESVLVEIYFTSGPAIVALAMAFWSSAAAMVLAALMTVAGTFGVVVALGRRAPRVARPQTRARGHVLAVAGMRTLVVALFPSGMALGILTVAIPAFATEDGHSTLAAMLMSAMSFGSLLGGIVYGSRLWPGLLERQFLLLSAVFALAITPLLFAGSVLPMALLLFPFGFALAPSMTCSLLLIDRVSAEGVRTEAYNWTMLSTFAGSSMGAVLAGMLVEHVTVKAAFGASLTVALIGVAVIAVRLGTLTLTAAAAARSGAAVSAARQPAS